MKLLYDPLHGRVTKQSQIADLVLTETVYPAELELPRHQHDFAYFCFVVRGHFRESFENRFRDCRHSTLIFHPASELHGDKFQADSHCFNFQLNERWIKRLSSSCRLEKPIDFYGGLPSSLAARLYQEFCDRDELSPIIIEGLMLEILGETARQLVNHQKGSAPPWLSLTREIIYDQFKESLSLSEIAKIVGVHETHLSRTFRRYYHCTVGQYQRKLRIEFAQRQLAESKLSLSEIALEAGFVDQSHFTKRFKQLTGISPDAYRKMFNPGYQKTNPDLP